MTAFKNIPLFEDMLENMHRETVKTHSNLGSSASAHSSNSRDAVSSM